MFRPTHLRNYNMNFGHLFIDDILSAYIAMQVTTPHRIPHRLSRPSPARTH
jgi:hypothetical protein